MNQRLSIRQINVIKHLKIKILMSLLPFIHKLPKPEKRQKILLNLRNLFMIRLLNQLKQMLPIIQIRRLLHQLINMNLNLTPQILYPLRSKKAIKKREKIGKKLKIEF